VFDVILRLQYPQSFQMMHCSC